MRLIREKMTVYLVVHLALPFLCKSSPGLSGASAVKVSEAMDMVEEFVCQADELLGQARIVASEARNIANLPEYIDQRFIHIITDIELIDYVKKDIKTVRTFIPDGAVEAERKRAKNSSQLTLVAEK